MRLTFKTVGNIEIGYRVWSDSDDERVKNETISVINERLDGVVDTHDICYIIKNQRREYLAAMLGCRPDNVNVQSCEIDCGMASSVFRLSGTFDFDIVNDFRSDELPSDGVLCDNIMTLIHESIHTYKDFIDESYLYDFLLAKFPDEPEIVDVSFYYDYKLASCEANLEK